jgi:hypothetical protein
MKPRHRLVLGAALGLFLLAGVVLADVARDVLGAESLNATRALAVPAWLDDLTQRSAIAYPAHAALGTVLERLDLSPAATAAQWLKAAAHARSDAELDWTARGISAAVARDDYGRAFPTVCKLRELGNASQVRAVDLAEIPCTLWTPQVAFEAVVTPGAVSVGDTVQITAFVTSATYISGLVDVEIHDAAEEKVTQWVFSDQQLVADRRHVYVVTWEIPPGLPAGEYEVKLGAFHPGWTAVHGWKRFAATVTVAP